MFVVALLAGVGLLWFGGDVLVRGASALAIRLRLTPAVIGLTVMALGTSFPELMVSVNAQLTDSPDIAFGNVVGSNLFNIGAVLGLCAVLRPLPIPGSTVRLEYPVMLVVSALVIVLARSDAQLDLWEGCFLVGALAFFLAYVVRLARREVTQSEQQRLRDAVEEVDIDSGKHPLFVPLLFVVGGGAFLHFGADWFVDGARELARLLGWKERVIGIVIAAPGTGAPELAATLAAVYKQKTDMAMANVVGSNIFNVLGILGVAAIVAPLECAPLILDWDLWWMLGISVLVGPLLFGHRLSRWNGAVLLGAYLLYLVMLF